MAHKAVNHASGGRAGPLGAAPTSSRMFVVISCIAAAASTYYGLTEPTSAAVSTPEPQLEATPTPDSLPVPTPPATEPEPQLAAAPAMAQALPVAAAPTPTQMVPPTNTPRGAPRVGILAGHWGSDTGAICADGLTEVEINRTVAEKVVRTLQALGYEVDLLQEFDPRLENYLADALVSIHADSCEPLPFATPAASGFKVASVEDSMVPERELELVNCLSQCYAARTKMYFHKNSITRDMTSYHTFYEINGLTPGAIIETGFMRNDRVMLVQQSDLVAQGIADGIVCFIEGTSH